MPTQSDTHYTNIAENIFQIVPNSHAIWE